MQASNLEKYSIYSKMETITNKSDLEAEGATDATLLGRLIIEPVYFNSILFSN